jgi:NADH:ubiquinone reductase (H+-translocating)
MQKLITGHTTGKPRVIIIGGGFAGLELAKALRDFKGEVVLFDRYNHHTFQPLLYQVASSGL